MTIDWGDAPTWVGAVFAAAAAAAAVWTLKSQRDQIGEQRDFIGQQATVLELQRGQLLAQAKDRRIDQARRISIRAEKASPGNTAYGPAEPDHWQVFILNNSGAPIRDVNVKYGSAYLSTDAQETGSGGRRLSVPDALIGPGRTAKFLSSNLPGAALQNNRPVAYFTDEAGIQWKLEESGETTEVAPPASPLAS
ncbi:hypothetical protein GCM10010495_73940 [Kitasatospora herbaricolor]|uniref:hypothetical protein n=1 Tax=Kitasatospora herbaricolor TaxID=68217 RepID=UPI00174813A4|nr:hypothetical protein [Kitasatospora herbaricolor]MDQ0305448.1 hypothetical protein [Kitasatospora herbaricolor]GGV45602.1 hypothetical protein GCM10010495_73940 [Kitasatospora herbaricolor]